MDYNYDKFIIRRLNIIEETFKFFIKNENLILSFKNHGLNFNQWCRVIIGWVTNQVMLSSLNLNPWDYETNEIFNKIYKFIDDNYYDEIIYFHNTLK